MYRCTCLPLVVVLKLSFFGISSSVTIFFGAGGELSPSSDKSSPSAGLLLVGGACSDKCLLRVPTVSRGRGTHSLGKPVGNWIYVCTNEAVTRPRNSRSKTPKISPSVSSLSSYSCQGIETFSSARRKQSIPGCS